MKTWHKIVGEILRLIPQNVGRVFARKFGGKFCVNWGNFRRNPASFCKSFYTNICRNPASSPASIHTTITTTNPQGMSDTYKLAYKSLVEKSVRRSILESTEKPLKNTPETRALLCDIITQSAQQQGKYVITGNDLPESFHAIHIDDIARESREIISMFVQEGFRTGRFYLMPMGMIVQGVWECKIYYHSTLYPAVEYFRDEMTYAFFISLHDNGYESLDEFLTRGGCFNVESEFERLRRYSL